MLVYHADAVGDCNRGRGERNPFAIDDNLPLSRLFETEEHLHQRALARAVLAHQRVDLPAPHGEINALIRGDTVGIHLGDPLHLHDQIVLFQIVLFHKMDSPLMEYVSSAARFCG
ncbi:hypothetical protein SDC9_121552 [bioreactor metagenome]|uniref:Uncharacterized protein n=1 Tax=bioreactor metagenome TaxID=1076179 RepID=A0A645CCA8_9ZZZZ